MVRRKKITNLQHKVKKEEVISIYVMYFKLYMNFKKEYFFIIIVDIYIFINYFTYLNIFIKQL